MPPRRVRRSDGFLDQALALFGRERSADGRPSYADFETGPLAAAEAAFAIDFEGQAEFVPGIAAIRLFLSDARAAFGPLLFTAVLLSDGTVELVDIEADDGYWQTISDD